ncbi:MAG: hypothetical protein RLZ86_1197 [Actinomycetota bacterium]
MPLSELIVDNLTSPAVLAFVLGIMAVAIRGDLRLPDQVSTLVSIYLLLAIGIKGGTRLREAEFADIWGPVLATVALGVITPIVAFVAARRIGRLNTTNAASLAAHYGSVSAVTFTAAEAFNKNSGILEEGFLPALVAILEIPGIVVALVIASRHLGSTVKTALVIGGIGSRDAVTAIEPFFITLFPGFLCLFLLDLGTLAGQRFTYVRRAGVRLVVLAVALPVLFGVLGTIAGTLAGLSAGGAAVLAIMSASASYIAAPAAVRVALPEADLGVSLGAAIGVTFPFNLVIGIPLFSELAQQIA